MALDISDDEELGEFIYRTSHTAKLLRERREKEDDKEDKKAATQESMDIQITTKKSRDSGKRKREVEEINPVQKSAARI